MNGKRLLWLFCIFVWLPFSLHAQGLLVVIDPYRPIPLPRPVPDPLRPTETSGYALDELTIRATVAEQSAKVQVSQTFHNPTSNTLEAQFVFPLPYDGAVQSMTLLVDGKEYPARLMNAEEAKNYYTETVRKNRDPALLQWLGSGLFQTSVFPIPPGAKRQVTIQYSQLCRASDGLVEFLFPLSTARYSSAPLRHLSIDVDVSSSHPLANIYSPTHSVQIERQGDNRARVRFESQGQTPRADFRLFHGKGGELLASSLLSHRATDAEDGFFLLLSSPELPKQTAQRVPKSVVLVVDRSGSMSGEKMNQAKEALKFVLNRLSEGDVFNIVAYDSEVEIFAPEMERYNAETKGKALAFADGLYPGGGTNIAGALERALVMFKDRDRPSYCIFLTDGLPTVGEQNEAKIVELAKNTNSSKARLFTFGVGDDVNSRLLDKLARDVLGKSHYFRPNENIESEVAKLYTRIEAPVLTEVSISLEGDGGAVRTNRIYPKQLGDLFAGEQVVITGRYSGSGAVKAVIQGKLAGEPKTFELRGELVAKSPDDRFRFVESLWAARRAGEIVDELDLHGQNQELIKELVELSTRHGILTPYTAFLADENTRLDRLSENVSEAGRRVRWIEESDGERGVAQRELKSRYQYAESIDADSYNRSALGLERQLSAAPAGGGLYAGGNTPGFGGGAPSQANGAAAGSFAFSTGALADDAKASQPPVQLAGKKTFFLKDAKWQDSTLASDQLSKAKQVARYSDEYFALLDRHGAELGKMLALDAPILVELDSVVYSFE